MKKEWYNTKWGKIIRIPLGIILFPIVFPIGLVVLCLVWIFDFILSPMYEVIVKDWDLQ